ncbi:MAG: hypothetical protein SH819_05690 [Cytophagales bacterium]|mgnify:CR=1 FL=1|nr:hypothetical protein [Cytophagales bacterium]
MKYSKILLTMTLIASVFVMCSEDKVQPAPSVTVDPATSANIPGGTVTTNINFSAPNGARQLFVYVAGVEVDVLEIGGSSSPIPYDYTIPSNALIGSTIIVSFQVVDSKGYLSQIANFVVTVGDPVNVLQGTLATQTLDASKPYLLKGQVFVPSGATLTIPAGTVIKGEKATKATLIIQPGGKLMANGTATSPVVFTSAKGVGERDRGDWGGVVLLGNAFVNQTAKPAIEGITPSQTFGSVAADGATPATNAADNSGTLRYVRIEYAGVELTPNNETNGLTLGGVGNGTTIENIQVSFGGDDSFEWFGGTVNAKYLISLSAWDDDFDTDFGWGGNVQFGLAVRNPFSADQSGSNAFESDNQSNGNAIAGICDGTTNTGCTRGVFSNITVLGPRETQSRSISGNYQNAAHLRRRTAISIFNSFFAGFRIGIRVDDQGTLDNLNSGAGVHGYNVLSVPGSTLIGTSTTASDAAFATGLTIPPEAAGNATAISAYWSNNNNTVFNNVTSTGVFDDLGVAGSLFWGAQTSSTFPSNPNFALGAGVAGGNNLNTGANFANPKLASFATTTYRGAFASGSDWTDGWSEFQPLNKVY